MPDDLFELINEQMANEIPALGATENQADPVARVKLSTSDGSWAWYPVELDRRTGACFGLIDGLEPHVGCFSLRKIQQLGSHLGVPVQRDVDFQPRSLTELRSELAASRQSGRCFTVDAPLEHEKLGSASIVQGEMSLMPESIAKTVPGLHEADRTDPLARAHWFTPDGTWNFFIVEFDRSTRDCFGLVVGSRVGLETFNVDEVQNLRDSLGMQAQRNQHWTPPLRDTASHSRT